MGYIDNERSCNPFRERVKQYEGSLHFFNQFFTQDNYGKSIYNFAKMLEDPFLPKFSPEVPFIRNYNEPNNISQYSEKKIVEDFIIKSFKKEKENESIDKYLPNFCIR